MKRRNFSYGSQILIISYILVFFIFIFVVVVDFLTFKSQNIYISLALIALLVITYPALKIFMRFADGENGELDVRNALGKLPDGYYYLWDLMFPDSKINIDFAVFGATGVWAIEVKNYRKTIITEQNIAKELKQAYAEKISLQNFLKGLGYDLPVASLLVLTNKKTKIHFGMSPVKGVYVIGIKWLDELITKHSSGYLTPAKAFELKESLKNYTSRI